MNKLIRMRLIALAAGAAAALLLSQCSFEPFGGGTEGGNISGRFVNDDGTVSAKVNVRLIPSDYNPGDDDQADRIRSSVTANDGSFLFKGIPQGVYSIEAKDSAEDRLSLITRVAVVDSSDKDVPADTLRSPGTIVISLPANADLSAGYIYIPGTTIYTRLTSGQRYAIVNAPSGITLPAICYATQSDPAPMVLRYDANVLSGDTAVVAHSGWYYARKLGLNTTATGASVPQNVAGFPVVVRLTQDNFDFWQANSDGSDLRFARSDTVRLPYEIERWDPETKRAEVWVRVDTIYGNNDRQFITMYWGNNAAIDSSNGAEVFDTAGHYLAVWHLDKNGNDATSSGHDAAAGSAIDTTGIIGPCKGFRGSDSIKIAGLLGSPSSITLSAWAQLDSTSSGSGSEILSIGDAALIRMDYQLANLGTIGSIHLTGDSTFYNVSSGRFLKQTGWHLITYTFNKTTHSHTLYIDGTKAAARTDSIASIIYSGVGKDTYLGKHGNGKTDFNFFGRIDEVRVCRAALPEERIKLEYMNQKAQDALVVFR